MPMTRDDRVLAAHADLGVHRARHHWGPAIGLVALGAAAAVFPLGCVQSEQITQSVEMISPRTSGGILVNEPDAEGLARVASAMQKSSMPQISPGVLAMVEERESRRISAAALDQEAQEKIEPGVTPVILPPNAGKLISLKKLSRYEVQELVGSLGLRIQTELGYRPASDAQAALLGRAPDGVAPGPVFAREGADGTLALIRFGSTRYLSQLPQLWVVGVMIGGDKVVAINPDIESVQANIDASQGQIEQMRTGLTQSDVAREIIQLSYTDTASALNTLKGLGINTVPTIEGLPATMNFDQLPMVTKMPAPSDEQMGLVGDQETARGAFGQTSTPAKAAALNAEVNAAPSSQLMVIYHPAHPEQFSTVRTILDEYIDRPARLVFIEGLVLEISEDGLEELGVEWSFKDGPTDLILGSLDPTGVTDTLIFSGLDSRDVVRDWGVQIQALVRDGKAEVLTRPSILTMNNRQATIRVGEDIPIATSSEGFSNNSNKVAFNFKYIATGILLNIRPRISESGDEVSMLVDTIVSAPVPGRDLEIKSSDGELLASAPTVSTRRVQTYARIRNKTPFIIGGLVSRDRTISQDKVPILGDLPWIGAAFRSERVETLKREVIIVLTPYVLDEHNTINRALPKDDDLFDNTGNKLFRDAYRIRAEDVFDLRFLAENKRLSLYRDLAKEVVANNFHLASVKPFSEFATNHVPGENILVHRMIYEVIKRTKVDARVNPNRIIYFEEKDVEGYHVQFLGRTLQRLGGGDSVDSFLDAHEGKALAITFHYDRDSMEQQRLASEPIPEIRIVDCPDRDAWQQILWDMNQPSSDGIQRFTILINSPADIVRLQRAMMLKLIVLLNGGEESLSLTNFSIGKILHVPERDADKVSVVDADVARYFFHTELYYAAVIKHIEQTLDELDEAFKDPQIQMYMSNPNTLRENNLTD
ncbi:MAG: type II secretion system protein GspD [Phycisphaerales bacterium]|nr:type II secretion system protein GspD [Phycisphaerales bacterium]